MNYLLVIIDQYNQVNTTNGLTAHFSTFEATSVFPGVWIVRTDTDAKTFYQGLQQAAGKPIRAVVMWANQEQIQKSWIPEEAKNWAQKAA